MHTNTHPPPTHTHTHTDSNEYSIVAFSKNATIISVDNKIRKYCYGSVRNKLITIVNYYLEYGLFCIVYSRQPRLGLASYSFLLCGFVCYSRQPRLGLARYSLFALWLCLFVCLFVIVASPRLGLATYSLFASWLCLSFCLSVDLFKNGLLYASET